MDCQRMAAMAASGVIGASKGMPGTRRQRPRCQGTTTCPMRPLSAQLAGSLGQIRWALAQESLALHLQQHRQALGSIKPHNKPERRHLEHHATPFVDRFVGCVMCSRYSINDIKHLVLELGGGRVRLTRCP